MRKKHLTVESGFWEFAKVADPNECWEWQGKRDNHGYGRFFCNSKWYRAHRVAYELFCAPIPEGLKALHRCDNPPCYNPNHIFIGTQADNVKDMIDKGREPRGEQRPIAKLTDSIVSQIKQELANTTEPYDSISVRYGVTVNAIYSIAKGLTWKHVQGPTPIEMRRFHPRNPGARLTESDVKDIRRLKESGLSMSEIARQYTVNFSTISLLINGKTWRHVE